MEACQNPEVLRVIMFISQILKVVFIAVPIGLILMIGLDLFKNITAGKEDDMKKNVSIAIKRIIFCVCVFFVPTIVNLVNSIVNEVLEDTDINYAECFKNANVVYIEDRIVKIAEEAVEKARTERTMQAVLEAESAIEKLEEGQEKQNLTTQINTIKEEVKQEIANNIEEDEPKNPVRPNTGDNDDNDDGGSSSGNSDFDNYGEGGKEGDYFAPIQTTDIYYISRMSSTPGCYNNVYHDLTIGSGTPIYAAMDGTASFEQWYTTQNGKTVLASYGNVITLTASDGTYIYYAHLEKFAGPVEMKDYPTCTFPCSASNYTISKHSAGTFEVKKGDLIGYTGTTGNSSGPHLHVEIHEGGSRYCVSNPWLKFGMQY